MQLDTQEYLDMVERTGRLCFIDTEATGLKGDYHSVLVGTVKPFGDVPRTTFTKQPGNDQRVVREFRDMIESFSCMVTYYGKGFDVKLLNTRLTRWGLEPLRKMYHIDLFFALKQHLLTARKSQAHLLRFFGCEQKKMDLSPELWNEIIANPKKNMETMIQRCESDTEGLEALYRKTRHLIRDVKCC